MNPKKKKKRPPVCSSTKMARLAGVSKASKVAVAAKAQKKSPLASDLSADAVIVTAVTEEVPDLATVASPVSAALSNPDTTSPLWVVGSTLPMEMEDITLASEGIVTPKVPRDSKSALGGESSIHNSCEGVTTEALPEARPVQNYASLLKASAQLEELGTPTEHINGAPFVLIPDENIEAAKEEFKDFIFARFHGEFPSMGRIIGVINAVWAKAGPRIFVHNIGEGCYLLRVTNPKTKEWLLSRTCWNIAGYPMFVAPWSPNFTPEEAPITTAIVPVELRNVPYLLFNRQSLSRLATAIGKPDSLAPETEKKENFEVAKLYVRVDLTKELPTKIISGFSSGREVEISVTYPWLPVKCSSCGKYGHSAEKCRFGGKKVKGTTARERSVFVAGDRRKHHSRPSRRRDRRKSSLSSKVKDVQSSELEEGEIISSETPVHSNEARGDDLRNVSTVDSSGMEEGSAKGDNVKLPSVLQLGVLDPRVEVSDQVETGSPVSEAPFLLAHGRKSGRKAPIQH